MRTFQRVLNRAIRVLAPDRVPSLGQTESASAAPDTGEGVTRFGGVDAGHGGTSPVEPQPCTS
jgi:hypothetical protein